MTTEKSRMILTLRENMAVRIGEDIRIIRAIGARRILIEAPKSVRITRETIDEKAEFDIDRKSKERTKT